MPKVMVDSDDNFFFQVKRLQKAMNGAWQFYGPLCKNSNKMYDNFQKKEGQIGMTLQLKSPSQYIGQRSITFTTFGAQIDQTFPLTVDKEIGVSLGYTLQEQIYDMGADGFMEELGEGAASSYGGIAEDNIAAAIPAYTYRGYGDGVTPINSYGMLADMVEKFIDLGLPRNKVKAMLLNTIFPQIVDTGNNQFVPNRNEKNSMEYEVGSFSRCEFFKAQILPEHTAGDVGLTKSQVVKIKSLTTTMVNGVASTVLVLEGYSNSVTDAIKENDLLTIGYNQGYRFLNRATHVACSQKFQVRAAADADSNGSGEITVVVDPGIIWDTTNPLSNINKAIDSTAITAGVYVTVAYSHKCGVITCNDTIYAPMPTLGDADPYKTAAGYDKTTGASSRIYGGQLGVGQPSKGWIMDGLQGIAFEKNCNMRILIPVTQGS
jgi:hypothetical protein